MGDENGSELCSVPVRLVRIRKWGTPRTCQHMGKLEPYEQCWECKMVGYFPVYKAMLNRIVCGNTLRHRDISPQMVRVLGRSTQVHRDGKN